MRFLLALAVLALPLLAQDWSVERLFSRPFVWGTSPENVTWSKQGHTLAFLWNEEGRRFLDLYAYHPDQGKRVRLTNLESVRDEINLTEEEKDDRRKHHLAPLPGLASFHLSSDGERAAFSYRGDLFVVPTSGETSALRLTKTKTAETSPRLSPDGSKIAYIRAGQLFVQDLGNGQLLQVTDLENDGESIEDYDWSPDASRFFFVVRKGAVREMILPNYTGRFVTAPSFQRTVAGDEPAESAVYVISSDGLDLQSMELGDWGGEVHLTTPKWSPDSAKLLLVTVHPQMKKQRLLVINTKSGKATTVGEETDPKWVEAAFATWSPDSQRILFTSDRDGWSHLYVAPAAGGDPKQLTRGNWEIHTESFSRDPQWVRDYIYYASTEKATSERHLYRLKPDGSGKEQLSRAEGLNIGLVSEDGLHTAWMLADLDKPLDLYVDDERVTRSPRPEFSEYEWPETRFVQFSSRVDGSTVSAKILLPPGYRLEDRSQPPRPAVFFIHGAGYATSVLKQWGSYQELRYAFNCYLAHKGYVVLDIDYRGSSGYGRDWRTDVYLHLGGLDLDDVLGGVDYLSSLGNIDMKRLGLWGVSYGGFMTNMAMFLSPDTFSAGVSWAAVNDWENYNAYYTAERLTTPAENPEAYRRSSPIHFSSLLKNPLLVVHGMVDDNVLFQDAVQLTQKLILEGGNFSHIYYPQESHGFVRDETLVDAFRRSAEWLDRHLK